MKKGADSHVMRHRMHRLGAGRLEAIWTRETLICVIFHHRAMVVSQSSLPPSLVRLAFNRTLCGLVNRLQIKAKSER